MSCHFSYSHVSLNPCRSLSKLARSNMVKYIEILSYLLLSSDHFADFNKASCNVLGIEDHITACFSFPTFGWSLLPHDTSSFIWALDPFWCLQRSSSVSDLCLSSLPPPLLCPLCSLIFPLKNKQTNKKNRSSLHGLVVNEPD